MTRRVYLVGDGARPHVARAIDALVERIDGRVEVAGADRTAAADLSSVSADLIVVLGGDGALIAAARRLGDNDIPVLGVNFGKLGFLAAVRNSEFESVADKVIVDGEYALSRRMRVEATVRHADGRVTGPIRGLNDAVVERWNARSLSVNFVVDGEVATTYRGDGVIVATPTGSTAHSLAAGGPIVEPGVRALVVSPICAHSVSNRPLLLRADQRVTLGVAGGSERPGLAVDGQVFVDLAFGDEVDVSASERDFQLAVPKGRTYFEVLRSRLRWGGQPPLEDV